MPNKKLLRRLESLFAGSSPPAKDSPPPTPEPAGAPRPEPAGSTAPRLLGWTWETDALGAYTFCSDEVEAVLGFTPQEMLGKTLASLLLNGDEAAGRQLAEAMGSGHPITNLRLQTQRKDGQAISLITHGRPILDEAGHFSGYHGVTHLAELERERLEPATPEAAPAAPGRTLTVAEWQAFLLKQGEQGFGYLDSQKGLVPLGDFTTPEMNEALERGELVFYDAPEAAPPGEAGRVGRALAIPIQLQDQTIGVLDFFDENSEHVWSEDDLALAQAVADQLALALENARLFNATRDQLTKRTLLYEVTRAAASATDLTQALQSAAAALSRVLPDSEIGILLLDDEEATLRIRASVGLPPDLVQHLTVHMGEGVVGRVAQSNLPALIPDVLQVPYYIAGTDDKLSELAVPLALGDRVIGVLNAESPRLNAYDEQDLQLLSTLAGTLSAIIVNNNLLAQITRERERLALLYEVLQRLTTTLDLDALFDTLLEFAPRLGARHAYLLMLGESEAEATFRSTLPGRDRFTESQARDFAHTLARQGLERWVLENRRPALVRDSRLDERWYTAPSHVEEEPARSVISVPLRTQRGAVIGMLAYTHPHPGLFTEDQVPLVESIASQAGVALENARLYAQMRLQRRNAEALARATQAMSGVLEEIELMQVLAEQLFETYHPESAVISRWEPAPHLLTLLTIRLGEADAKARYTPGQSFRAAERPDLLEVIQSNRGSVRLLEAEADGRVRESMAMPLLYGGEVEGVVEVIHLSPRPGPSAERSASGGLTQDDLDLFQSIMTAFATALQSARLYAMQRETAERLAEVDRLKSQFLANMSHELRTPLNSIIGFSRVILKGIDGPITDLQAQDLTSIYNAGQHLLGLINDILDMSRIEAGKMELVLDEVNLRDITRGVLSTTTALVKDKPISLQEEIAPDLPSVRADSMRVRQVLLNLLSNAAKFTDSGSITVRARAVMAPGVQSGQSEPFVEVSVIDTGSGIAPQDMSKLFEPFSQVDASPTRKTGGSGLGLNICRHLVELHGGRIWAESAGVPGKGSTFTFILPVHRPELPGARAGLETLPGARVILVVDDDQGVMNLYRRYLEPHGYTVVGVTKSTDAIGRAEDLEPLVILLDVLMPHRDGWQVLADLKQTPATRDIPVIMCTIVSDKERALSMGAVDYLTKPILESDLLRALSKLRAPASSSGPASNETRRALAGTGPASNSPATLPEG